MTYDNPEEQPLDPVMERVRKKMLRLMVISISIMMVGLLAVLFAIIYKFNSRSDGEIVSAGQVPGSVAEINLGLPSDAEILTSSVEGNRIVLDVKSANGNRQLIIIDTQSGKLVSKINLH